MAQPLSSADPPTPPNGIATAGGAKLWPWLVSGVLIAVIITALVIIATAGDRETVGNPVPVGAFSLDFTATGTFTLYDYDSNQNSSTCSGTDGYSDISVGTQVRVSNTAGHIVALGELEPSSYRPGECEFTFEVTGVPQGEEFYQIEVSHRGTLTYSEEEMRSGLALSLGP